MERSNILEEVDSRVSAASVIVVAVTRSLENSPCSIMAPCLQMRTPIMSVSWRTISAGAGKYQPPELDGRSQGWETVILPGYTEFSSGVTAQMGDGGLQDDYATCSLQACIPDFS